jgi:hypothetical protein
MRIERIAPWAAGVLAAAVVLIGSFTPVALGQQASNVELTIDSPSPGASIVLGQTMTIGGWAVDPRSEAGPGIEQVQVSVDAPPGANPRRLSARHGISRPDVAQQLGRTDWTYSGFTVDLPVEGLVPGPHTLFVAAHTGQSEWVVRTVPILVTPPYSAAGPVQPVNLSAPSLLVLQANPAPVQAVPAPLHAVPPPPPAAIPPCRISSYDTAPPFCR